MLVKENPTSFKKGHIPWSKGTKGLVPSPWNKDTKGLVKPNIGSFTKGMMSDELHFKWKGDNVGYFALHTWVVRKKGKALICSKCGTNKNVQWANISHEYKREVNDFVEMCSKCHRAFDMPFLGVATKKYKL